MANRPASAGSARRPAPTGKGAPPFDPAAPPPVHHDVRPVAPPVALPPNAPHASQSAGYVGPRTARRLASRDREDAQASGLAWVPYVIVLAGAAAGTLLAWHGSRYAGRGTGLLGASLLAAALARLVLPPRYAAVLSSRRRAFDVLTFAVFGAAVLGVALSLP